MGFRCELCDEFLPMFQFSQLCPTCYKLRTIVKCYDAMAVLKNAEDNFLVSRARELEEREKDLKFYQNEEERLQSEMVEKYKPSIEQIEALKKEVEDKQIIPDDIEKVKADKHNEVIDNTLTPIKEEVEPLPPLEHKMGEGVAQPDKPLNPKAKHYDTRKHKKRNNYVD